MMTTTSACTQCQRTFDHESRYPAIPEYKQKRPLFSGRLLLAETACLLVARGGFELWVMRRQTKHGFNRLQTPKPDLILSHPLLTGAHGGMTSSACTPNKPDPVVIVYVTPRGQHNKHATIGHPRWLAMHHGFGRRLRMEHAHKITAMRPAPDSSPGPAH